MLKRTLLLVSPGKLSIKLSQLVFENSGDTKRIPVEEIGFVVIESPQIIITSYCLEYLAEHKVCVLVCDAYHMPCAIMTTISGHSLTQRYTAAQLASTLAKRNRFWRQTVIAKISNQAKCLERLGRSTGILPAIVKKVKSGDSGNLEATAAKYYFQNIMDNFSRSQDGSGLNAALNYGYAVLRAATARALTCSGLLCVCGIHHCNQYNSFALADDVMEPYRVWVDELVFKNTEYFSGEKLLSGQKSLLLSILVADVFIDHKRCLLQNALTHTATSLARCYTGESKVIMYPEFCSDD